MLLVVAAAAPEVTLTDRKPEILLVDDRAENIMVLRATLSSLDVTMVDANSGREALKLLLDREFAVILLDVMMPEIDGFETARLIREREKSRLTPIIFITAMSLNDADAFKGYSVGAVDYIMKPFVPDILRSKVSVFVDLFKKTEELKRQQDIIRQIEQREYQAKLRETTQRMEAETEIVRTEHRAVRAMVQHAPMGFARL
ncbi:MAG TPA: response regulator, partial [Trichormus sp.]